MPPPDLADAALTRLAVGVLIINRLGEIVLANDIARLMFAPTDAVGMEISSFFRVTCLANGCDLAAASQAGVRCEAVRCWLPDGRLIDGHSAPLDGGGAAITLIDVTLYVQKEDGTGLDMVTGLPQRAAVMRYLNLASLVANPATASAPLAVIRLDIERFTELSHALGIDHSNQLLHKIADRLRGLATKDEMLAYLGGNGFVIVQTNQPQPQAARQFAARALDIIARGYSIAGQSISVQVRAGIAVATGEETPEILLKHADLAVPRGPRDHMHHTRLFEPSLAQQSQERVLLEADLRRALILKQFMLVYQPQYRLSDNKLEGFEALIRWQHPVRGYVSPGMFIPLAEELGLIIPIGEYVVRTACQQVAMWPDPVRVSVNLSAVQFHNPHLVDSVKSSLAAAKLSPERLELEITESALLDDSDNALAVLSEFKSMGVAISLDDFGTGYSSLSYLHQFPFDTLKIDQSFVRGAETSASQAAILRAIVTLGASLGMHTTAEGVETLQQLENVRHLGCTHVQGYLTGRPQSAADASKLLQVKDGPPPSEVAYSKAV